MGSLVIGSKDVKIRLTLPNMPSILIESGLSLNSTTNQTVQEVFGIGTKQPIDLVDQNVQYTASLTMQSGEYHLLLDAINNNSTGILYAELHEVPEFTLSRTYVITDAAQPKTVTVSLLRCKIESESSDVNANDVQTTTALQLRGIGIRRESAPIVG